jgi:hypothetical protein
MTFVSPVPQITPEFFWLFVTVAGSNCWTMAQDASERTPQHDHALIFPSACNQFYDPMITTVLVTFFVRIQTECGSLHISFHMHIHYLFATLKRARVRTAPPASYAVF